MQWIASFFNERFQVVSIKDTSYNGLKLGNTNQKYFPAINTGVLQGTNLGQYFSCYIFNDLPEAISEDKVWLFANDVSHVIYGTDAGELITNQGTIGPT